MITPNYQDDQVTINPRLWRRDVTEEELFQRYASHVGPYVSGDDDE